MEIHPEVFDTVFPKLVDAWVNQRGVFETGVYLPQNEIYDLGLDNVALDNALFYLSIATLHGKSSDLIYQEVAKSIIQDPENLKLFETQYIASYLEDDFADKLLASGIHRQNEIADRWKATAGYLNSLGIIRPSELILQSGSITQFLKDHSLKQNEKRGTGIKGISGKTGSLYVVFCQEQGWLKSIKNAFPVDVWISRILIQIGAIKGIGYWEVDEMELHLREILCEYYNEKGIYVSHLNGALWRLGATLCTKAPTCYQDLCPIPDDCLSIIRGITEGKPGKRGVDFDLLYNEDGKSRFKPVYRQFEI